MDVELPEIPLLSGDFLWMVPYEDLEDTQVRMGIMMAEKDGSIYVDKVLEESPAEKAGIEAGDRLLTLDGLPVESMGDVLLVVNTKKPGDDIEVAVERGGELLELRPHFPLP